jgi:hypothetical protein
MNGCKFGGTVWAVSPQKNRCLAPSNSSMDGPPSLCKGILNEILFKNSCLYLTSIVSIVFQQATWFLGRLLDVKWSGQQTERQLRFMRLTHLGRYSKQSGII